ncbi:MAG: hypothetical protein IKG27_01225 [Bacilli bacterium]|nr:hypothetical protein [Bacilli bacterium]
MKNIKKLVEGENVKIVAAVLALILVIVPLWYVKNNGKKIPVKKNYETFAHTDAGIINEEEFEKLKFSNISLITDKGYTTFNATVTNTGDTENTIEEVYIDLIDKTGKNSISLKATIGKLKPNEKTQISTTAKGKYKEVVTKKIREFKN